MSDRSDVEPTADEPAGAENAERAILRIAGRMAKLGGWHVSLPDRIVTWSEETATIHDEPAGFSPSDEAAAIAYYAPEHREIIRRALGACVTDGTPFDLQLQIVTARGRRVAVRAIGEAARSASGAITHVHGAFQDVCDRKADAEQIRSLGNRLLDTLENLRDGFFTLDREWRFTYLNSVAERLLHRDRAGLLGKNVWEEFPDAIGTESDVGYHRAVAEGVKVEFEQFYPPIDRWLHVDAQPTNEGLAVYFRDVTERRRSREVLRESEERFRLLAKATNDAIYDWNLLTDTLWWNDGLTTLFGFAREEIEPSSAWWAAQIHPDDERSVVGSLRAAIDGTAEAWSSEYRFVRKDGSAAYVLDRGHIIRDATGRAIRMVGGMADLTERRRAEERLLEQATLLDKANDAIVVRDLAHRILYWNRSSERIYGWTSEEALGRPIEELLYAEPSSFLAATDTAILNGEWLGEIEQRTKDGRALVVEGRWTLVRAEDGSPKSILAINTDVTQRKQVEAQFLRAQRMESIGALAGGIAHDLNNALAPIVFTVSALREMEKDERRREDLAMIESSAQRGADMVRQLLSFARGADGRRLRIDVGTVAAEVEKIVRETFPKDITFRRTAPSTPWRVSADPTQLHQVLTNLCVNARDAMPHGGTLTIAIEHVVLDDVYAGMNLEAKPGPYVLVRVEDSGSGMPPSIVDRIFEPFFTTKEVGKGTGLGLSTAHAIIRNHGGFIHVYSEVGVGTRFKIYIPADVSEKAADDAAIEQSMLPRGDGELVLVVDDEEAIRTVARRMLERFGYRVLLAANGAEAVALYAQHREAIAVVLTDMTMPVMDGPATIVALRALSPKLRIIGSSGLNANGNVAKAVGAGVQHFVPKPYTADTMLRVLRKVRTEPE